VLKENARQQKEEEISVQNGDGEASRNIAPGGIVRQGGETEGGGGVPLLLGKKKNREEGAPQRQSKTVTGKGAIKTRTQLANTDSEEGEKKHLTLKD